MSVAESRAKSAALLTLLDGLRELRGAVSNRLGAFFVPGRIELAGKHTDYAGGRSLVCAIERGISMLAVPRSDSQVYIRDARRGLEARFSLDGNAESVPRDWSNYALTVARRMARDVPSARNGADILFTSDLPLASGMSSSSALIVAVFFALAEANSLSHTDFFRSFIHSQEDLALYLSAIESGAPFGSSSETRGVGTLGGSEDHVAIVCSRAGSLRQYSYCPIRLEREIHLPETCVFVIAVSGVEADKTGNALESYNRASRAVRKILELWRDATGRDDQSLAAVLASASDASGRLRRILSKSAAAGFPPEFLLNRLAQFAEESNELVPGLSAALENADLQSAGGLTDRSQRLAETLLGNQTPETVELARSARTLGAAAASGFGAGFGGSVWALVMSEQAENFRNRWAAHYHERYPSRVQASQFLITRAGPGVVQFRPPSPD
ncbi:MAG TPA: galactokinase family protein [Candidatus Acidoferrales bacterium]|nr:galactokinase family protein [Candidatus Acidoferrales bacterium]